MILRPFIQLVFYDRNIGIKVTDDLLQMCRYIEKRIMKALSLAYLLSPGTAMGGGGRKCKDQEHQFYCIVISNI